MDNSRVRRNRGKVQAYDDTGSYLNFSSAQQADDLEDQDQLTKFKKLSDIHIKANAIGGAITDEWICQYQQIEISEQMKIMEARTQLVVECECCKKKINKASFQQLKLGTDLRDLGFMGSGYPQFFTFIKFSILILVALFISSGSYNIISNFILGQACIKDEPAASVTVELKTSISEFLMRIFHNENSDNIHHCHWNWATSTSLANKMNDPRLLLLQDFMNLFSILTIIIVFQIFRKVQNELDQECDLSTTSIIDYSVIIQNVPTDLQLSEISASLNNLIREKELEYRKFILKKIFEQEEQQLSPSQKTKLETLVKNQIQKVNFSFNFDKFSALKKPNEQIILSPQHKQIQGQHLYDSFTQQIPLIDEKYQDFQFNGIMFASFSREQFKDYILQHNNISNSLFKKIFQRQTQLKIKDNFLFVEEAPDPTDVYWENLHISTSKKYFWRILSGMFTFLTLLVCIFAILFLNYHQKQISKSNAQKLPDGTIIHQENIFTKIIGIAIGLLVYGMNEILTILLGKFAKLERYSTRTLHDASMAYKISIAQFFNTALITFSLNILIPYLANGGYEASQEIYRKHGLVETQENILLTNSVMPIVMLWIDTSRIQKHVFLKIAEQYNGQLCFYPLTQQIQDMTLGDYNTLAQQPQFVMATIYPIIINNMFVIAFYAPLIPLALLYGSVSLFGFYWTLKYQLLNHRVVKYDISKELSLEMTELLEVVLVIYCTSNLIFSHILSFNSPETRIEQKSYGALIGILIGLIHMILPMGKINEWIFPLNKAEANLKSFSDSYTEFDSAYEQYNPIDKYKHNISKI